MCHFAELALLLGFLIAAFPEGTTYRGVESVERRRPKGGSSNPSRIKPMTWSNWYFVLLRNLWCNSFIKLIICTAFKLSNQWVLSTLGAPLYWRALWNEAVRMVTTDFPSYDKNQWDDCQQWSHINTVALCNTFSCKKNMSKEKSLLNKHVGECYITRLNICVVEVNACISNVDIFT